MSDSKETQKKLTEFLKQLPEEQQSLVMKLASSVKNSLGDKERSVESIVEELKNQLSSHPKEVSELRGIAEKFAQTSDEKTKKDVKKLLNEFDKPGKKGRKK